MRVLLVFLDGVGIGPDDPGLNPFFTAELSTLRELWGGSVPTLSDPRRTLTVRARRAATFPLDATLGIDGLPQSGTGQISLLTGLNAAREFGRHFGPWAPVPLRPLLTEHNVLRTFASDGRRVAFANAYPRRWADTLGQRRPAAIPLAAHHAGLMSRHEEALGRGEAVASGITNEGWIEHLGFGDLPVITARQAGRNLAWVAAVHDLTLYAHYATDLAGHTGLLDDAHAVLARVDALLGGIFEVASDELLVLLTSDHGNIEELDGSHTTNPVLGMLVGSGADELAAELGSLTDVAPALRSWFRR